MSLYLLENAGYKTSLKVKGNMVTLRNEIEDIAVTLSLEAFDEAVEHVKEERKEPLPTFEDVRGILKNEKGEKDGSPGNRND